MIVRVALILATLCLSLPASSGAQRVQGTVLDATTGLPIPAALLTIRDSARTVIARRLTATEGTFNLQFVIPVHTMTVEFVGYTPQTLEIERNATEVLMIRLQPQPLTLTSVVVQAENRCGKSEDPNIVTVWYAARAALGASRVSSRRRYRTREFLRTLDPKLRVLGSDSMTFSVTRGTDAYEAVSADSLAEFGFVHYSGGKRFFYGPDAELLLSDDFVNTHCFGITRKNAPAGKVGLEFWPMPGRKETDIRGVMWVTEKSGELDFVEYTYTGLTERVNENYMSGRVDFERLKDGSWVVRDWFIRLPRKAEFKIGMGGRPQKLDVGATEGGGEFLGYHRDSSPPDEIGTITGSIYDSITGGPLVDAPVYLAGTEHETRTDAAGVFRFDSITTGIHYVVYVHPVMASRPLAERTARLSLTRGKTATAKLAVPREETLIALYCTANQMREAAKQLGWRNAQRAVVGRVISRGEPVAGVIVDVEWDLGQVGSQSINKKIKSYNTETGKNGEFIICGVPGGLDFALRVIDREQVVSEVYVSDPALLLVKDIDLDSE